MPLKTTRLLALLAASLVLNSCLAVPLIVDDSEYFTVHVRAPLKSGDTPLATKIIDAFARQHGYVRHTEVSPSVLRWYELPNNTSLENEFTLPLRVVFYPGDDGELCVAMGSNNTNTPLVKDLIGTFSSAFGKDRVQTTPRKSAHHVEWKFWGDS